MSGRQKTRSTRVATFWSDKFTRARGNPRATAGVRFDLLCARVYDLPAADQRQAWTEVNGALRQLLDNIHTITRGATKP